MFEILGWLYVLAPLGCWAALARTRTVGAVVAVPLLAYAAAVVALWNDRLFLRAEAELYLAYPVLTGLLMTAGALVERRSLGPRPADEGHRVGGSAVTLGACALVGAFAVFLLYPFSAYEGFQPNPAALSLPADLTVGTDSGPDRGCALAGCLRTLTVRGAADLPPAEVAARLRARLLSDGWTPGPGGRLEHPNGWLIDRRVIHAWITETPHGVSVELAGGPTYQGPA
ncbi:hypothetical protein ACWEQL_07870 [Kitasatospora sp. NPDC004240]